MQWHNAKEASECWLQLDWDDLFRAELFVRSDEFRAALIAAGVIDGPESWFLERFGPDCA